MAGAGTDASSSNPSPTVRTSSYTTVSSGSVSHARLRNSSSVVAHRMSSATSRSRHSGQRRIPRTLRSTQHGDTGGPLLLSSSSSSNSLAGRYRTISGATIQHHTDDIAHTDTVSSPLLRFASLRLDTAVDGEGPRLGQSVPLAMVEGSSDLDEFPALSTRPMSDQNPVCPVPLTIAMHAQFRMNRTQSDNTTTEWPVSRSLSGNPSNSFVDVSSSCATENMGNNTNCSVEPIGVNSGNGDIPSIDDSSNRLQNECISHPSSGELGSGDSASSPQPNTSESTFFSVRFPPRRDLNQSSNLTTTPSSNTNQEPEADHDFYRSDPNRPPYRTTDHPQKILVGLNDLRQRGQFCDVVLQAGSSRLPAHRNVLASSSQYFYAMFTGPMAEARSPCVQIQGIDENALVQLIDFIYTGEISVTEENVQTLLPAANLLQLPSVRDSCCEFLQSQLHPSNCLGIQRFADLHDCPDLLASSRRFTEQHFGELLEQDDEFLTLTAEQLGQLIASDRLAVTEDQVFEAVLRWIAHDVSNRQQAARNLCGRVRFSLLPRDYLVRLSQSEAFLTANPWCKDYLIEALSYHLLSWDEKLRVTSERAKPRTPVGLPKVSVWTVSFIVSCALATNLFERIAHYIRYTERRHTNAPHLSDSSTFSSAPTSAVNASSSPGCLQQHHPLYLPVCPWSIQQPLFS
ncbi:Ring canal kelch protein [Fasciola gigantica]|uniref:Ring canal kelch protein n=1 Tax=Fasciola gigantica TaxID=46835 RepID=A0A504Z7I6_FASGI|nr:Ring canal kelch protein [Fasciola gigantica]